MGGNDGPLFNEDPICKYAFADLAGPEDLLSDSRPKDLLQENLCFPRRIFGFIITIVIDSPDRPTVTGMRRVELH
jgi:hypothetical protein